MALLQRYELIEIFQALTLSIVQTEGNNHET